MDDIRIEEWIDRIEPNKAARTDWRNGRQKMRKVIKKREGVNSEQLTLSIRARRKHRKNSRIRESMRDCMEYETGWDIIDDDDEQYVDESNSITVNREEWWLKFVGLADKLPWPQEEVDDRSISQTYENTPWIMTEEDNRDRGHTDDEGKRLGVTG